MDFKKSQAQTNLSLVPDQSEDEINSIPENLNIIS
jgi:hypothetical protein